MDDIIMKGIGCWLLALIEAIIAILSYLLGHWINGIPSEIAVLIASMLGSTQVFIFLLVKHFFKITDDDYHARLENK